MSLLKIAWRSMQQRSLSSWLTGFSMALGVALVVAVLVILNTVDRTFRRNTGGFSMIIGAKGGRLDLVLNTVYHLRKPVGNIPFDYYLEYCAGSDFDPPETFARLDKSGDGRISLAIEAPPGAQNLLERADKVLDRYATREELAEVHKEYEGLARKLQEEKAALDALAAEFATLDADGDGRVSLAGPEENGDSEHKDAEREDATSENPYGEDSLQTDLLQRADRQADGFVTRREFEELKEQERDDLKAAFADLDRDGDGRISLSDEAPAGDENSAERELLESVDAEPDDFVTAAELQHLMQALAERATEVQENLALLGELTGGFAALDADGDGRIALDDEAPDDFLKADLLEQADEFPDGYVSPEELAEALTSPGRFYRGVGPGGVAIPYCLGDNYKGHRVVGTTPQMFEIEYPDGPDMVKYQFAQGRNMHKDYTSPEHFYEAVIGAEAAEKTGLKVGDRFKPAHGVTESEDAVEHDAFQVVGVLERTGTPNDRALFVNMEGFYLLSGHSLSGFSEQGKRLPLEEREVTAILLRTDPENPIAALSLPKAINRGKIAQAVQPAKEIFELFDNLVGNIQLALVVLAVLIVVVAGVGIMVSIYNSMNDRLRDIAVMRALGAGRRTVMGVVLLESIMLSLGGGIGGFLLGHGLIAAARPAVAAYTGVTIQFLQFVPLELALIPGLIVLATIAGYVPALKAYRTDVSRVLSASP